MATVTNDDIQDPRAPSLCGSTDSHVPSSGSSLPSLSWESNSSMDSSETVDFPLFPEISLSDAMQLQYIPAQTLLEDLTNCKAPRPYAWGVRNTTPYTPSHHPERPHKCPIVACEYHVKGFRQKHHQIKHTLTHYRGKIVCGFCPGSGSTDEESFLHPSLFKEHLVLVHGVNSTASKCRSTGRALMHGEKPACDEKRATGKCSICSTTFTNVQNFHEHLDNCLLRVIHQGESSRVVTKRQFAITLPKPDEELVEPDTAESHSVNTFSITNTFDSSENSRPRPDNNGFANCNNSDSETSKWDPIREELGRIWGFRAPEAYSDNSDSLGANPLYKSISSPLPSLNRSIMDEDPALVPRAPTLDDACDKESDPDLYGLDVIRQFDSCFGFHARYSDLSGFSSFSALDPPWNKKPPIHLQATTKISDAAPQELPQNSEAETLADTTHNSEYNVAPFQVTGHDEGECETAVSLCDEGTIDDDSTETEAYSDSVSQASSWPGTPNTAERAEILSPIFEINRRRIVDRLMSEFHSLLGHGSSFRNCVGSSKSPSSQTPPSSSPAGSSSQKPQGTKRERDREGSEPPDDREDDGQRRQRPKVTSPGGTLTSRKFACPYYRRNASKHQDYRSCAGPGWNSVRRVKEHLYRRHALPARCVRCCDTFKTNYELAEHQRLPESCEIRFAEPCEGFDREKEQRLKKRKRTESDEVGKWKEMYRILFPDDPENSIPSPYYDDQAAVLLQTQRDELARYDQYLSRELPRLLRSRLTAAVLEASENVEGQLRSQLVDLVRNCQAELYQSYQHPSQIPIPSLSPSRDDPGGSTLDHTQSQSALVDISAFKPLPVMDTNFHVPASIDIQSSLLCNTPNRQNYSDSGYASYLGSFPNPQMIVNSDDGFANGLPLRFASETTPQNFTGWDEYDFFLNSEISNTNDQPDLGETNESQILEEL